MISTSEGFESDVDSPDGNIVGADASRPEVFAQQFQHVRSEIYGFIDRRLNARLRRRLDTSDIVQETQLAALRHYAAYLEQPSVPLRIWLLQTAQQQLVNAYRTHLVTAKRSVNREVAWSDCSSVLIARGFARSGSTPSRHVQREEVTRLMFQAVDDMPDVDREIILMRHIENRPYEEIAVLLEIQPEAARQRCGRALLKLRSAMNKLGLLEQSS